MAVVLVTEALLQCMIALTNNFTGFTPNHTANYN